MARSAGYISARVTLMSFLIVMVDGYDTLMISFIAPLLARQWKLTPVAIGNLFAIGYFGAIVGAVAIGPLADRFGRRPTLVASLGLAAIATAGCAGAPSFEMLVALRFLSGIGLGGALPAVVSLTAEHALPERRSGTVTLMYIGFPFGAVVGGALTAALIGRGWPVFFLGTAAACVLAMLATLQLPESPALACNSSAHAAARPAFMEQFGEGRLGAALSLWLGLFCLLLLTYFLLSWTPSILIARGAAPGQAALGGVILNLGGIIGAVATAPVVNRLGPYGPVAVMVGLGALLVGVFGSVGNASVPLSLLLLFFCGACVLGGQLNFPAMIVALFPPYVRGAGGGWTVGVGRGGSIVGPLIGGFLIAAHLGTGNLFMIATVPALIAAGSVFAASRLSRRAKPSGTV